MQFSHLLLRRYISALKNSPLSVLPTFIIYLALGAWLVLPGGIALAEKSTDKSSYAPNLLVENLDNGWVILNWTAPGDDGNSGQASAYDLRYQESSLGPIDTDSEWETAIQVDGEPNPAPAGQSNQMVVANLEAGASYYFCIKTLDECDNCSGLSNSPLVSVDSEYGDFIPGDANGDGALLGSDVTYLVLFFRGINPQPDPFFAGDANGDCLVIGSDVTRLVGYFRGTASPPVDGDCEPIIAVND